ncbi:hypothetical protein T4B_10860 [Trichinella pseudospiralis]|uniref:Uncharacterized protein n=1 Tax=Trichinella pseudospiralis TaxID=6337 RepID=A0A0V1K1S7_TRIPS|nr:hypothetical protein T4A_3610 [Trichinella pseudospiralis]KRZ33402.1 hypothetical protein T4B_10860 [Trichinella pseudospiralis]KRZ41179.1 hypothetical protein T4C_5079 [Trichinella pseudospiralis]
MFLLCLPEDDDIIEIHEACFPRQSLHCFFYQPLKRRWGVARYKRHEAELEESHGCGKHCFLLVCFGNFDLPVAGRQVGSAELFDPRQRIQRIIYARDGLGVDARLGWRSSICGSQRRIAGSRPSSAPAQPVSSIDLRLV